MLRYSSAAAAAGAASDPEGGMVEHIGTRADLDRLVASGAALAIDVTDRGSARSVLFSNAFNDVAGRLQDVRFCRMSLPAEAELAGLFGIAHGPALIVFRRGIGLYAGPAEFDAAGLERLLGRALGLDMDNVRNAIDGERREMGAAAGGRSCPTTGYTPVGD
jgi:thioredoxin 1